MAASHALAMESTPDPPHRLASTIRGDRLNSVSDGFGLVLRPERGQGSAQVCPMPSESKSPPRSVPCGSSSVTEGLAQVGHELSHPLARCVDGEAHIGLRVSIRNASKNEQVIFRGLATRDQLAPLCLAGFDRAKDEYSPPGNARARFQLAQPNSRSAVHRIARCGR